MRLVDKEQFLELKSGTVYIELLRRNGDFFFGNLCVKAESLCKRSDYRKSLNEPKITTEDTEEGCLNFNNKTNADFNDIKDNSYFDGTKFLILEKEEVGSLIDILTNAYNTYE